MILAIDTAGPWVAVAVGNDGVVKASRAIAARLNHNEILARMVQETLAEAGVVRPERIAVDVGPGSFTGTRVGVSLALGLAQGWGIPVTTFSSFQVAASWGPAGADTVYVAFPIVGAEWCRARMVREGGRWREDDLEELDAEAIAASTDGAPLIVPWGDAGIGTRPPGERNPAAALVSLATAEMSAVNPATIRVRYVGLSQAERNFHARKQGR